MNQNGIAHFRLFSQQIANPKFKSVKELVAHMGAMQAQDFNMAKWAIGLRLKKSTQENIDAAINSGSIIRTHILRPTWHFISSEDIYWMLDLTAPRIKASMKGRHKQLELTEIVLKKCNKIIQKILSENQIATRKEIIRELNKARISTDENRASHILFNAELDKIICSGKMKGKETTYALLHERVAEPKSLQKQVALEKLATKYFKSHSPATLQDFVWWSGLAITDAKSGMEMIKKDFIPEKINDKEYWIPKSFAPSKKIENSVFLLPAFDEFLISYKERSASVMTEHASKAFSKNGIFWPTVLINEKVMGTWKREIKKDKLSITINFFDSKTKLKNNLLEEAVARLELFLNMKAGIIVTHH